MKYDQFLAQRLRRVYKPYDFTVDIKEFPDKIQLIVYESEITTFELNERMNIMKYLHVLKELIREYNIKCEIKGLHKEYELRD